MSFVLFPLYGRTLKANAILNLFPMKFGGNGANLPHLYCFNLGEELLMRSSFSPHYCISLVLTLDHILNMKNSACNYTSSVITFSFSTQVLNISLSNKNVMSNSNNVYQTQQIP